VGTAEAWTFAWEAVRGYWVSGGWLLVPLAVATFCILLLYLRLFARLRAAVRFPESCVDRLEQDLLSGVEFDRIRTWLAPLPGAVPRLARHILSRLAGGVPFREAFAQCRDAEVSEFRSSFLVLGALVAAAPLLGLLGTVLGMITTFDAVGLRSGETGTLVADGISQALITTQVGLAAALPGTFGLAHLQRLYRRLCSDLSLCESCLYLALERRSGALAVREAGP
jgi:biopolymer transport protein ExbB